jgi:predicted transcriptional regulator
MELDEVIKNRRKVLGISQLDLAEMAEDKSCHSQGYRAR